MIACLFCLSAVHAQYRVSGHIVMGEDGRGTPLEFANVALRTADSVFVAGAVSDAEGTFVLKNIGRGDYIVAASYTGFTPRFITLNGLAQSVDLGEILLEEETAQLEAVTVTASNITNRTDRLIVFVTGQQKAASSNGINLLNALQLPRLSVNPVTNEVSLPGNGNLQFCINGVKVNPDNVRALQSGDVVRVEYLDNPGLRYGGADAVINYVTKREVAGGSISIDLGNAVTTSFGDDQVAARFNYGKSELGINYSVRYRNPSEIWGDEVRTFHFADGRTMTRFSDGSPGDMSENAHNLSVNYSLLENEKYFFNATLRHTITNEEKMRYSSQYILSNVSDATRTYQGINSDQRLPSIDLYYMRTLKNKQNIILNTVGTYIRSDLRQRYEERKGEATISNIVSDVEGNKYSIIGEGIYEKTFENAGRFTAGIMHTQAFADNAYTGTVGNVTKMQQADSYLYAEYTGKKNGFGYTGGVGLSHSQARQEGEADYTFYTFRPKLTLQYDFSRSMFARLRGEVRNVSPSLSSLSAVDQYIDTLRIMRGNPLLKPNPNYDVNLLFSWRKGVYGLNFYNSYLYNPNPVMETVFRENDKFIYTYENHKNLQKLNSELTLSAGPVNDFLMISLAGGVNHYVSNGNTYRHTYTNVYYRVQVMAMYKRFTALFAANSANDRFSGETMQGGENSHLFMLAYKAGKFNVGAGLMLPFSGKYERYTENRNSYTPAEMRAYANDFSRMLLLKFAWNFDFGHKSDKRADKRLNNIDTDTGIMKAN
jgi:hypothetical protein